jgi:formiminoglutamate deiminase
MTDAYWCEYALVGGVVESSVRVTVAGGRFLSIEVGVDPSSDDQRDPRRLPGITIPGLANAHSHSFHRALRSRVQRDGGTFWTWRDLMYAAAERLDPDCYLRLARATFAEMAMAGVSCVGEFHYLHHRPDGRAYADPNAMGAALLAAAQEAGIRITLLDALYLHGGLDGGAYAPPTGVQRRFSDGSVAAWVDRVAALEATDTARVGAAIHSVRAVDPAAMGEVAAWASGSDRPVHAHVSEQAAENEQCLIAHGATPLGVLANAGVLETRFTAVHATHLTERDVVSLAGSTVCMCPTTERDLGDGIGPTPELIAAGAELSLGSDSHAMIDLFEEARAVELDERLRSGRRGVHPAGSLLDAATAAGHRCLGWDDAGAIEVGRRADLVTVSLATPRAAGAGADALGEAVVFAANASDVTDVLIDGRLVVTDGRHVSVDVVGELDELIPELMGD